jgi:hypothetical protein
MANDAFALSLENAEPSEAVFEAIQDAVMETARGRWFLLEYARRNRHADTTVLLAALDRIEGLVRTRPDQQPASAEATNPAPIKPEGDAAGKAGEPVLIAAAARLRAAFEPVQDLAWSLRERGEPRCELLDIYIREIAQTCETLETLQSELDAAEAPPGPAQDDQDDNAGPTAKEDEGGPAPAFRIAASMPADILETKIPAPDDFGSENEDAISAMAYADGEDPMPGILAAAQKMAQTARAGTARTEAIDGAAHVADAPSAPQKAVEPAAPVAQPMPAQAASSEQITSPEQAAPAAPRMSASERMRGLFNELHQARWGSQDGAHAADARPQDSTPERNDDVRDAWPRVPARAPAPQNGAASFSAAPKERSDPLAPIISLSDEEKIALFS